MCKHMPFILLLRYCHAYESQSEFRSSSEKVPLNYDIKHLDRVETTATVIQEVIRPCHQMNK